MEEQISARQAAVMHAPTPVTTKEDHRAAEPDEWT